MFRADYKNITKEMGWLVFFENYKLPKCMKDGNWKLLTKLEGHHLDCDENGCYNQRTKVIRRQECLDSCNIWLTFLLQCICLPQKAALRKHSLTEYKVINGFEWLSQKHQYIA